MRTTLLSILSTLILLASAGSAGAEATAQFAAGGLRAPDEANVNGMRFTLLYGENNQMSGVDFGILSVSESSQLAGAAFILGMHKLNSDMDGGAAFSLVNVHDGNDSGLNAAFINLVNSADNAVDFGFVNIARGSTMVDLGGFNMAKKSTAQLGFINVTDEIKGFQLGFINIAKNGFLPVFPFFNFPKN